MHIFFNIMYSLHHIVFLFWLQAARTVAPRFVQLLPPPLMIQHFTEDADQLLLWSGKGTVQVKIAAVIMGYLRSVCSYEVGI